MLSHVQLFVTPWTVACQASLSMGFPSQETGMGCHFLLQGNLPDCGIKPVSPALQDDSLPIESHGKPITLGDWLKNILLQFLRKYILPMFSSKIFTVPSLIFALIHFEFILCVCC